MKHIDKKTSEQLMFLAKKLPLVMVNTHEKHIMTKEELDEMGYVGAEELPDGTYLYKAPVQIAKNHYRCMRNRFRKHGMPGLEKYIDEIKALKNA